MSDFDTLAMQTGGVDHEDPAADFLAREQKDLAGLDEDFDFDHISSNDVSKMNDVSELNNQFNDLNLANGDSDEINHQVNGLKIEDTYKTKSPSPQQSVEQKQTFQPPREEPEKIKKWREEHQRLLEQKDAEEAKKHEELRQTAKHELEEWYARYWEQLEKSKTNNRNAEKEWVAERDAEVPGQEWEKIAKMCDFNPKSTRNVKDTSRMRSILLQLKQNPNPQINKS